ncbi:MAG: MarR family winged helix-turn-helix transcriptional regulator [Pseudomonadota bacterium]
MHKPLIDPEQVDDFIILRVRAFARKVQSALVRDVLKQENLPVLEWQLLFSVARFGSCHLAYITRITSIDPAHASRAIAALERKGLITRRNDPKHKRRKLISLTEDGVALFDRIWPRAQQSLEVATGALDRPDLDELKRLLDQINSAAEALSDGNYADTEEDKTTKKERPLAFSA